MTGTIIFWAIMLTAVVIVSRETIVRMDYHIRGYQKVNGQWVQTMYPQHYCLEATALCFCMMGAVAIAVIFFTAVAVCDFSGLSQKYAIQTLVHLKPSLMGK